jgi:hypothetical protein
MRLAQKLTAENVLMAVAAAVVEDLPVAAAAVKIIDADIKILYCKADLKKQSDRLL